MARTIAKRMPRVPSGHVGAACVLMIRCSPSAAAFSRAAAPTPGGSRAVPGRDAVDEPRERIGGRRIVDLHHVLRVPLARAREVERADEARVVADHDLRASRPGLRRATTAWTVAGERRALDDRPQERDLPGADAVRAPLPEDVVRRSSTTPTTGAPLFTTSRACRGSARGQHRRARGSAARARCASRRGARAPRRFPA
jgi:hypothetical protein